MQILDLLGMYFDAVVVKVQTFLLLFRFPLAILCNMSIIRITIIIFRLNFKAVEIDARLGFILQLFALDNGPVRYVASKCPELILWNGTPTQLENNHLALSKFMEFDTYEMKMILTKCPKIFMQQDTDYIQGISCYFTT